MSEHDEVILNTGYVKGGYMDGEAGGDPRVTREQAGAEFDAWLGSTEREAGAKALRGAAEAVPVDLWATFGMTPRRAVEGFQEWLRKRADKIEGGQ